MSATELLEQIADIGRDRQRGGYSRHIFSTAEMELREWFVDRATALGLTIQHDRNTNIWAWWGAPGPDALVTGSHLDSVPGGGAFDGPLGVASALAAVQSLRRNGFRPARPLAVVVFAEEEGGRFGVPCLGSRLLSGAIDRDTAGKLVDGDGISFAEAAAGAGIDPARFGRDDAALSNIGQFVELHVEQGRGLIDIGAPVAVASTILAHGRWRFSVTGQGNHAGTTLPADRHDPMLPAAAAVLAARRAIGKTAGARATIGRLIPTPGGINVIPSTVDFWLDARAEKADETRKVVTEIVEITRDAASEEGCELTVREETFGDTVVFDAELRDTIADMLDGPILPTGAGHDAGILAAHVPTAMLFVRNPTGISHAPDEFAEEDDCEAGVAGLATVLRELAR